MASVFRQEVTGVVGLTIWGRRYRPLSRLQRYRLWLDRATR